MSADPEIVKLLTVTTAHLSKNTVDQLPKDAEDHVGLVDPPDWFPTFTRDEGWMFYIPPEPDFFNVNFAEAPKDLKEVFLFARMHGCVWLLFDSDGPIVDALFFYEW